MANKINVTMKAKGLTYECDRNEFALALKAWRLRAGKTQKEVAKEWNVSRFTIMRAEGAKDITWQMAYRLFNHLSKALQEENQ